MTGSPDPRVHVRDVSYRYEGGPFELAVPSLEVQPGSATLVIGPSGSGKTTLLHLLAGILPAQAGTIRVDGHDLSAGSALATDSAGRRAFRREHIGLVFQELALLDHLPVIENVMLPFFLDGERTLNDAVRDRARGLARRTGIEPLLHRLPRRLSQGERQRVALCRALVTEPNVVLADEPTGNLDPDTSSQVVDLMLQLVRERDAALVMVTHDHGLKPRFDGVLDLAALVETPA